MRRGLRRGQVFVVAMGVGTAVAIAPLAVDAAQRKARGIRAVTVDKQGRLRVAVANKPVVKVPGGVAVTNTPNVKVPDGVAVTNTPSVKVPEGLAVTNQPTVTVANQPSSVTALPPLEKNFNVLREDITNVVGHHLLGPGQRIAITEVSLTVRGDNAALTNHVRIFSRSEADCGAGPSVPVTLRTYSLHAGETRQFDYSGAPVLVDSNRCLGFQQTKWSGGTELDVAVSGFRF